MSVGHSTTSSTEQRKSWYVPRAKTPGICGFCGEAYQGRPDQKFCCASCRARANQPKKEPREVVKPVRPSRVCLHCGTVYVQKDLRKTRYCSRQCSFARHASRGPKPKSPTCRWCSKEFQRQTETTRFCSDECKTKAYERVCCQCGHTFPSVHKRKFCSDECSWKYYRPIQVGSVECIGCGKTVNLSSGFYEGRKYCSARCQKYVTRKTGKHRRRAWASSQPAESFTVRFLIARDKGICQLCKKPVNKKAVSPHLDSPTIDHVIPLSKGGSHTKANTQLACFGCNSLKGDRVDSLF